MSKNKYHIEEYERYLKGNMSPEEAHAFERMVLNDPFAREALEGLESQDPADVFGDIEQLSYKINQSRTSKFSWMRIAAVVSFLIISTAIVWLVITPSTEEEQLAMESEKVEEPSPETTIDTKEVTSVPPIEREEEEVMPEKSEMSKRDYANPVAAAPSTSSPATTSGPSIAISEPTETTEEEAFVEQIELDEAIVSDESVVAINFEDAIDANQGDGDEARAGEDELDGAFGFVDPGEDTFDTDDTFYKARLNATGAVSRAVAESEPIVLKETEDISTKSSRAEYSQAVTQSSATLAIAPSASASPVIGQKEFEKYLKKNLNYPDSARKNKIKGTVILELIVSQNGEISDVLVLQSLGYGCDQEAIRLINEGPRWNPGIINGEFVSDTIQVDILFKK